MLHIRQSRPNLGGHYTSWAVGDDRAVDVPDTVDAVSPVSGMSTLSSRASSEIPDQAGEPDGVDNTGGDAEGGAGNTGREGGVVEPSLRPEFRRFAEWVFGPQGVGSLQLIVVGDLAYGDRAPRHNLIIRRSITDGGISDFRVISHDNLVGELEVLGEYRDALEACPVEPLLEDLDLIMWGEETVDLTRFQCS